VKRNLVHKTGCELLYRKGFISAVEIIKLKGGANTSASFKFESQIKRSNNYIALSCSFLTLAGDLIISGYIA